MQQVGNLRHCSMRKRARRVKLMLDWGVHGRRMQLMGLDDSGQCPICMEADSLEHITFDCNYTAAVHKRQDWISGIKVMLQHHHRQNLEAGQRKGRSLHRTARYFYPAPAQTVSVARTMAHIPQRAPERQATQHNSWHAMGEGCLQIHTGTGSATV